MVQLMIDENIQVVGKKPQKRQTNFYILLLGTYIIIFYWIVIDIGFNFLIKNVNQ